MKCTNVKDMDCEIEINEDLRCTPIVMTQHIIVMRTQWGLDADTAKFVMTQHISVITELSYVSRLKLHESYSCMGPDTNTNVMTQLSYVSRWKLHGSHSYIGIDADTGQPMHSHSYSHVEDSMWTPCGRLTPPPRPHHLHRGNGCARVIVDKLIAQSLMAVDGYMSLCIKYIL